MFTPLPFGLLSAATEVTPVSTIDQQPGSMQRNRWEAGITWQSHCPGGSGTYDPCVAVTRSTVDPSAPSNPGDPPPKEPTSEFLLRGATSFAVYARFDCNPIGFWERATSLATEALVRVEGFEVERMFAHNVMVSVLQPVTSLTLHIRR